MGQEIDDPQIEYGSDCPACTIPVGATWPAGETPRFIYCKFWGITDCGLGHHPPPNGRIFRLEQHAVNPCHWFLIGSVWHINYFATLIAPPLSQLRLDDHDGWSMFTDQRRKCAGEYALWTNDQTACILAYGGAGGHAMIWWNTDLLELTELVGVPPEDSLFYDPFKVSSITNVHRLSRDIDHTCIRILQYNY